MAVTEAQKRATAKYERENYDKILTRFPKGTKERIQATGAQSVNGFIIKCVLDVLDGSTAEEEQQEEPEEPQQEQIFVDVQGVRVPAELDESSEIIPESVQLPRLQFTNTKKQENIA